jgi:hypothetical protein
MASVDNNAPKAKSEPLQGPVSYEGYFEYAGLSRFDQYVIAIAGALIAAKGKLSIGLTRDAIKQAKELMEAVDSE